MSKPLFVSAAVAALALLSAQAASAEPRTQFLDKAIKGDNSEIMLGKLAQQRGASQGVRDYGATLMQDHQMARRQAASLDRSIGGTPPRQPMAKARNEYYRLQRMRGRGFDREFVRYMVNDHEKDIDDFQKFARQHHGKVGDLARQTLPTLHKHLDIAMRLSRQRD